MKDTISVDFDGVLHDYRAGWTGYEPTGEPVPGAREFVCQLVTDGYEVVISSCRAYTQIGRDGIREWLERHDFPRVSVTCEKPHARFYVDDRGIRFDGCFGAVRAAMNQPVWFAEAAEPNFGERQ